jgi:Flp pilus assembly protein TadB
MATLILIIAVGMCLGLVLLWTGSTAREGSYRKGQGWYLDVSTPREALQQRSGLWDASVPSKNSVRLQFVGGLALIALGGVAWLVAGSGVAGAVVAIMGLLVLGLAWDGRRRRQRLADDGDAPTS